MYNLHILWEDLQHIQDPDLLSCIILVKKYKYEGKPFMITLTLDIAFCGSLPFFKGKIDHTSVTYDENYVTLKFDTEEDAMMFKMRWL